MYSFDDWTLCHWERTSAVQCCHGQALIDKVIPMYFKPQNGVDQVGMSQIFISDKAGASSAHHHDLYYIRRNHPSIAPDYSGLPYVAILVDLGMETSKLTVQVDTLDAKCLRIYASALNETTYPFLKGQDQLIRILNDLYKRQSPPASGNLQQQLENQAQFGKSREKRHMNWK